MSHSRNILFQLSGSIACYKAAGIISYLVQQGHKVRTVCTESALEFIGPATLEGLTGQSPLSKVIAEGHMMDHIELARWADLAILCPASANTINKIAAGIADDMIGSLYLAIEPTKPYLIAPAMNTKMYQHPSVQESLGKLSTRGHKVLPADTGELACGEKGAGRLLDPEVIINEIYTSLGLPTNKTEKSNAKKVLVTSGGTREPIDGVRYLSNSSSGATGAEIADIFSSEGFAVTYLHAQNAIMPRANVHALCFDSFEDLNHLMQQQLAEHEFTATIHLAAVSDFSVSKIIQNSKSAAPDSNRKISSDSGLTLQLKKNFKILNRIWGYSKNKDIKIVGFKLTNSLDEKEHLAAVRKQLDCDHIHWVVHNDLNDIKRGLRLFKVYGHQKNGLEADSVKSVAKILIERIQDRRNYHDSVPRRGKQSDSWRSL